MLQPNLRHLGQSGRHLGGRLSGLATALGLGIVLFPGCGDDAGSDGGPSTCEVAAQCDDGDPCSIDVCGADGKCTADKAPDGVAPEQVVGDCKTIVCEDGRDTEEEDFFDVEDDLEACTIDRCDGTDIEHTPLEDGASCQVGQGSGTCEDEKCVVRCTPDSALTVCDDLNPCTQDGCVGEGASGVCRHGVFSGPTPGVSQQSGDCHEQRCIEGIETLAVDDYDVPDDGNDCTEGRCLLGDPLVEPSPAGTLCNGDYVCDGGGSCLECLSVADCPDLDEESYPCNEPACESGSCTLGYRDAGTPLPAIYQQSGDCQTAVCDGFGSSSGEPDDDDTPPDTSPCVAEACSGGGVTYEPLDAGTPCGGGNVCDGEGSCCQPLTCDQLGAQCGSVDDGCGLTLQCGTCDDGESCEDNVCCGASPSCETLGKNCGSLLSCGESFECGECDDGDTCGVAISNVCGCTDGFQNQGEAGVDCGGPCAAACDDGTPCFDAADCASGFCIDGVCCDTSCSGACVACVEAKTGSADGTCDDVATGTDPDFECALDPVATCDRTGFCEAGACQLQPSGVECAAPACTGDLETSADTCDGAGNCVDGGSVTCPGLYTCDGDTCQSCSDGVLNGNELAIDCGGGAPCAGCPAGTACTNGATDCASGLCVDGVCCDTTCTGVCRSCALAGDEGTCTFRPPGVDPEDECPGNQDCNGSGSCN